MLKLFPIALQVSLQFQTSMRRPIGLMLWLATSFLVACTSERTFYSSASPDARKSIELRSNYMFNDWTIWMYATNGKITRKIFKSGDVREPVYAEAFWQDNSRVVVLECNSGLILEYNFDTGKLASVLPETLDSILAARNVGTAGHSYCYGSARIERYCMEKRPKGS